MEADEFELRHDDLLVRILWSRFKYPSAAGCGDACRAFVDGRAKETNFLKMKKQIFLWSITSALAGFLFGFDTVVISGAEQKIQALWGLGPGMHGIAMAAALYGTVVGSLLGGWPADRFGRKATLLWIGILYFVGAVGSALAPGVGTFIAARVIGGLGIGIPTVVAPMYISEITPPQHRGRLAGMFQFNIVFGILIAFVSNALLAGVGENAWRGMLSVA